MITPQDGAAPAPTPMDPEIKLLIERIHAKLIKSVKFSTHRRALEQVEEWIDMNPSQESPRPTTGAAADVQGMILEILHSWPKATEIYFSPLQGGRGIEAFQAELMLNGGQTKSFQAETLELALIEAYTWLFEKPPAPRGEQTKTGPAVLGMQGHHVMCSKGSGPRSECHICKSFDQVGAPEEAPSPAPQPGKEGVK